MISQPSISQSVSLASINAAASTLAGPVVGCSVLSAWWGAGTGYRGARGENITIKSEIVDQNFEARYKHGNIQKKGILNMHLNIRSLKNKLCEVKNVIKQHSPYILGLSESGMGYTVPIV